MKREVFTTSRELEYFSESELVTQTGYAREHWWPGVIVKELVDNSLDACEQSGIAPQVKVRFQGNELVVEDNGPGLKADVIEKILNFSTRTSDKAAYVSPTRGAQGNALKTVLAIPYVLSGGREGLVEIEACGIRHEIRVSTDQVAQQARIDHQTTEIVRNCGTVVRVVMDLASSKAPEPKPGIVQKLLADYALFNPHAAFELADHATTMQIAPTAPDWRKWLPTDPTSPHWYDAERLSGLIGCYVSAERNGGKVRTVRDFVSEFRGLARTAKQKQVTAAAGLERAYLHDLARDGKFDQKRIAVLLASMQELSAPVKPEALGILGEEHFRCRLQPEGKTFRYRKSHGIDKRGLPCLIETAFAIPGDTCAPRKAERDPRLPQDWMLVETEPKALRIGLNWSVPLGNALQNDAYRVDGNHVVCGLAALLAEQRINVYSDRVCLAIHMVNPRFQFVDRGKGSITLGGDDE